MIMLSARVKLDIWPKTRKCFCTNNKYLSSGDDLFRLVTRCCRYLGIDTATAANYPWPVGTGPRGAAATWDHATLRHNLGSNAPPAAGAGELESWVAGELERWEAPSWFWFMVTRGRSHPSYWHTAALASGVPLLDKVICILLTPGEMQYI